MTALLQVEGLHTHYGRAQVLFDLDLEVRAGEIVVLLGRNGAGKTTTLKSIMRLVRPSAGRIAFDGHDLARLEPHAIAQRGIGYVPEERRIFGELTVEENLEVGRRAAGEGRASWSIERLALLFPNLGDLRRRPAGRISGGEQQMLAIARTLMGNPRLLLLDEPSEGLAPVIVEQLARSIDAMRAEGLSVLLAEQNMRFAGAVANRAYVIETGHIRHESDMRALLDDRDTRERYLGV